MLLLLLSLLRRCVMLEVAASYSTAGRHGLGGRSWLLVLLLTRMIESWCYAAVIAFE